VSLQRIYERAPALHASAGARYLRAQVRPLWEAIQAAERGLDRLLEDERAHQPARLALAWLDADAEARAQYVDYLGAASLGVAALLQQMMPASPAEAEAWLVHAVAEQHADPDFNRAWIERVASDREA
jgi:hypothetical protein